MAQDSLRAALEKASEDNPEEQEQETAADDKADKGDEEKADDKADEADADDNADEPDADDDDEEPEHTQAEQEAAVRLYRQLTDPKQAEAVLAAIAKRAGYELKNLTAAEKKAVRSEIEETLQDVLGDDYTLLPPTLGKALQAILDARDAKTETRVKSLEEKLRAAEEIEYQRQVDATLSWAAETYPDFTDPVMNKRILREMRQLPPPPNADLKTYIKKIYKLAGGTTSNSSVAERNSRIKSNKDGQKPSDNARPARSTKPVTSLSDAIKFAYEEQFPNEK